VQLRDVADLRRTTSYWEPPENVNDGFRVSALDISNQTHDLVRQSGRMRATGDTLLAGSARQTEGNKLPNGR